MKSVLLHTLEVGICFALALALLRFFDIDTETKAMITGLLFAALAKFARESDIIPLEDYVNKK